MCFLLLLVSFAALPILIIGNKPFFSSMGRFRLRDLTVSTFVNLTASFYKKIYKTLERSTEKSLRKSFRGCSQNILRFKWNALVVLG